GDVVEGLCLVSQICCARCLGHFCHLQFEPFACIFYFFLLVNYVTSITWSNYLYSQYPMSFFYWCCLIDFIDLLVKDFCCYSRVGCDQDVINIDSHDHSRCLLDEEASVLSRLTKSILKKAGSDGLVPVASRLL